jgi:hypothetical protein
MSWYLIELLPELITNTFMAGGGGG